MFERTISQGRGQALISATTPAGPFSVRLYVNNGETATTQTGKAKTLRGAEQIATRMLTGHATMTKGGGS